MQMGFNRSLGLVVFLFSLVTIFFLIPLIPVEYADEGFGITPRHFPRFSAVLLLPLSCWLIVFPPDGTSSLNLKACGRSGATLAFSLAYLLGFSYIGYITSTCLALILLMYYFGSRNHWLIVTSSVLLPVVFFYLFQSVFSIRFPKGILF